MVLAPTLKVVYEGFILVQERKDGRVKFLMVKLELNVLYSQNYKDENSFIHSANLYWTVYQSGFYYVPGFIIPTCMPLSTSQSSWKGGGIK